MLSLISKMVKKRNAFLITVSMWVLHTSVVIAAENKLQDDSFNEELEDIIYQGLIEHEEKGTTPPSFDKAISELKVPEDFVRNNPVTTVKNIGICTACSATFKYLLIRSSLGTSRDLLVDTLTFLCKLLQISTERVCRGAIELNIDIFLYIFKEKRSSITEFKICATIVQDYGCFQSHRSQWNVNIPNQDHSYQVKKSQNKSFRVLQITDTHVDPLYKPHGNADCGEPLCCQNDQGQAPSGKEPAGKWGDYRNCDMPEHSFENLLQQITNQISRTGQHIDYVYFTGDIIGHRVWNTSRDSNTEQTKNMYNTLKKFFGSIPVYSIIGNHEPHPINIFSPPSIKNDLSTRWVFDVMAEEWAKWLPSSTEETIRYGGYYTVVVKPGFRIIALNSNICYTYNWWLLYDDVDPFSQLKWLAETLKTAENNNEVVHILSHIPPGDATCIQEWTRQFRRIVERFAHVIQGQFNGHTHFDELRVFYNKSNLEQVVNVAYNGGSFTTFSNLNPNYRYYTIDQDTFEVLDYEQWIYDMDAANSQPNKPPNWFKQYSFKDAYGLKSLKNSEIGHLINRLAHSTTLQNKYFRFKVRGAGPSLLQGCKTSCNDDNICSIVTTEVGDNTKCQTLTKKN